MVLTQEQKQSFIRDGYIVLRNVASREMVDDALRVIDKAFADGKCTYDPTKQDAVPSFNDEVQRAPEIGRIISDTVIMEACDDLLGNGNSRCAKKAQIAHRLTDERLKAQGMGMTQKMPKHKWHIDGGSGIYEKTASGFTMLVGVALSDGQDVDENRGQLNVWTGKWRFQRMRECGMVRRFCILIRLFSLFVFCGLCRLSLQVASTALRTSETGTVHVADLRNDSIV